MIRTIIAVCAILFIITEIFDAHSINGAEQSREELMAIVGEQECNASETDVIRCKRIDFARTM